jgi:hypothetical protein
MTTIHIAPDDLLSPSAQQLIAALNAELDARYPEDGTANHFRLDPEEVAGFVRISAFGEYDESPLSVFLAKSLA